MLTTDAIDTAGRPKRTRAPSPLHIAPIMVQHDVAAAMLGGISARTLDQLVASGRLRARQITKGRVGYLVRDLEALAASLPEVKPGQPRAPAAGDQEP